MDPKVFITTSRDPSPKLKQLAKVFIIILFIIFIHFIIIHSSWLIINNYL